MQDGRMKPSPDDATDLAVLGTATALPSPFVEVMPPEVAGLIDRLDDHARAAQGAFAGNTVRALGADTRVFAAWCRANGHAMLPA